MGGRTAVHGASARAEIDDQVSSLYRARLGHLVAMFRAKGIGPDEANDLAHETVLRTLTHLKRHGRTQEDLGPLTRTIARNLLIERLRKAGPALVSLSDDIDAASDEPDPLEQAVHAERRDAVRQAMASLTPRHRRVIELWMQGRTPADIARELGIKRNAADAILHRARRTLASRLGPKSLWGSVVLVFLRAKASVRQAGHTVAQFAGDPMSALPAGITLAAVGIAAGFSVSPASPAQAETGSRPPALVQRATHDGAAAVAGAVDATSASASAPSAATVAKPEYGKKARAEVENPMTGEKDDTLIDITYDPDAGGRGPADDVLEPVAAAVLHR